MLDPEYIFHMAEGAEDISEQLHQAILNAIVGRLMTRLADGKNYLTSTDRWNLQVLTDAGYLLEDIQKEIAARTKQQLDEIRRIFEDAAIESSAWDMAVYQAAGLSPAPLTKSPQLIRLLQRDYAKTAGEWQNFTGTLANAAQQTFIRQCDEAYHLVTGGAMGYPQAVRRAIEAIAADGVTVQYTRRNMAGQLEVYHTDTIETATLRAVRTGARQACDAITDARMDEMDWDIVLASSHLGARTGDGGENFTNHSWWQGKFYSRSGKDKRFPPWSDVGEGDVQGFGGPNCRHSKGPGDGVHNPFEHFDSEENRKKEQLDQHQRLLERRIRKTRREVMTLQDAIDKAPDEATRAELEAAHRKKALLLQRQEEAYGSFCKENDLRKLYDRLEVARYGPKQAKAAAQAAEVDSSIVPGKQMATTDTTEWPSEGTPISKEQYYELRDYAEQKGFSLEGFKKYDGDISVIKGAIDDADEIAKTFPALREKKRHVVFSLNHRMSSADYAETRRHVIHLNANAFRSAEALQADYSQKARERWFVSGTTYRSIVKHELGHVVAEKYGIDGLRIAMGITGLNAKETLQYIAENLSVYASRVKKGSEIISEVFSEIYGTEHPSEFSLRFFDECVKIVQQKGR